MVLQLCVLTPENYKHSLHVELCDCVSARSFNLPTNAFRILQMAAPVTATVLSLSLALSPPFAAQIYVAAERKQSLRAEWRSGSVLGP